MIGQVRTPRSPPKYADDRGSVGESWARSRRSAHVLGFHEIQVDEDDLEGQPTVVYDLDDSVSFDDHVVHAQVLT